ncbi:L,D-transpeptidase family protein [Enterovirga sp.]|uniref:L,D-transpeptidase family protein n=1 Tax=Enterovirga sp. TaxID=2026350 RepID=UPI0026386F97|nr:L,D-transpeptidase family protein [Enterovirga sp.]MDB5590359.1 Peptidoglycan-binding domain 1 protein [Enterovirga sp.]
MNLSRRAFLLSAAAAAAASPALAQADQAEWAQNYDGAARVRVPRSNTPILSREALATTEEMVERYRDIVARGGWQPLSLPGGMKVGTRSPAVLDLRRRLIVEGDLDPSAGASQIYDSYVEAGVRRFQSRHGLGATGLLNTGTVAAMNVPAETRMRQLELNAVRLRSYSGNLGHRYVIVNIPAALVETVEDGRVHTRHAAGVGKIDRQSPVMNAKIQAVNFNPFWTVPASIIRKDLIPKMRKEPSYLTDNKIRIFNSAGQELRPETVNWNSDEATRYMFRQDPGGEVNSMGFVRINIPNPHGVYMHDTPSKGIFGDDFRFVSSGCVRVQNVRDYITWLLKDTPGWDRHRIEEVFAAGSRTDAPLREAVPVYWTYVTAWAAPDGLVQFRDDIYNKDGLGRVPMAARQQVEPENELLN